MTVQPTTHVWRYMSFSKFVWMLQMKQLWLSNIRFFDDKWELMLDNSQINFVVSHSDSSTEYTLARLRDIIKQYRENTFVNCWNASENESYALWRIYCPTPEGVAIQTTLERLQKSVEPLPVLEVSYTHEEHDPLNLYKLASRKRPAFAYEQEVRVVLKQDFTDPNQPDAVVFGTGLPWDPELHIENIWLHPDAQHWFAESVTEIVRLLAPKLSRQVWYSNMNIAPPFSSV